tara:strand:+ start:102 stop:323 length:222 start_codon:yes stop_codon:yes gene_type:complete
MEKIKELIVFIRENQNNNKTLKSLFASQFLSKLSEEELSGLKRSIDKEMFSRQQGLIDEKILYLESRGYKVEK